jgi:hypothetical protein
MDTKQIAFAFFEWMSANYKKNHNEDWIKKESTWFADGFKLRELYDIFINYLILYTHEKAIK